MAVNHKIFSSCFSICHILQSCGLCLGLLNMVTLRLFLSLFFIISFFFMSFIQSTLFLCLVLLAFCFFIVLNLFLFCSVWYALLFFLIYVGGLLVLFFYILSLNSKPLLSISFRASFNFSFLCFLIFSSLFFVTLFFFYDYLDLYLFSFVFDNSYSLFGVFKGPMMILVGAFLLLVLFSVSLFTCVVKGAFRPICF